MEKKIILQQEISIMVNGFTSPVITDNLLEKIVTAKINLIANDKQQYDYPPMILWQGEEYNNIGQWTDEDANNRIIEILNLK